MAGDIVTDLYVVIGKLYYENRILVQRLAELEQENQELKEGKNENPKF